MINTANEARQGAAATESFRNEMVKQGEQTQAILATTAFRTQIPGNSHPLPPHDPRLPSNYHLLPTRE